MQTPSLYLYMRVKVMYLLVPGELPVNDLHPPKLVKIVIRLVFNYVEKHPVSTRGKPHPVPPASRPCPHLSPNPSLRHNSLCHCQPQP